MAQNSAKKIEYKCVSCGKTYVDQTRNFSSSKSGIYAANNYRLPICNNCVNKLFDQYLEFYEKNYAKAMKRICEMFDIYYDVSIAQKCRTVPSDKSKVGFYIKQMNLGQYKDKTYIDYLNEEKIRLGKNDIENVEGLEDDEIELLDSIKSIFGNVKDKKDAKILKYYYDDWMIKTGAESITQISIIKNICWNLLSIDKARELGEDTSRLEETLLKNITFGGWKPDNKNENLSNETFGSWIKKYELTKPIEDVGDKSELKEIIDAYFYGHLGKSAGLKNIYTEAYDRHMKKYTVEMSEEENKEAEDMRTKLFGS